MTHPNPLVRRHLVPFEPDWDAISQEIAAGDPEAIEPDLDEICCSKFEGGRSAWDAHKARHPYKAAQYARHIAKPLGI